MPSIITGLNEIYDRWLGVDEKWEGNTPRYPHKTTFDRLSRNGWNDLSGKQLVTDLYHQILMNWSGKPYTGRENWRFKKQHNLTETKPRAEASLERTIVRITDSNWVNQVPVASGVNGTRGARNIDLIHRSGTEFTFIELKVTDKHPLFAAFEIVSYGVVYAFSRIHAEQLGYRIDKRELLRASEVRLQVLAPRGYYAIESIVWLKGLEKCLNDGLKQFAHEKLQIPMGFEFSTFPSDFTWNPADHKDLGVRQNLLWSLHKRTSLDELSKSS